MQTEKEAIERQANEQERKKTQLKQAIRQEQHLHDSLVAEIEDANGLMEGLDDNVNVVLAKDYMIKVEELKKTNADKGFQLFQRVKDAESAEALQWKVAMTFDEVKVLTQTVLKDRADELYRAQDGTADQPDDGTGEFFKSRKQGFSRLSSGSRVGDTPKDPILEKF